MGVLIETSWECFACEAQNHTHVLKPSIFQPTVTRKTCECCDSSFMLHIKKVSGKPELKYGFLPKCTMLSAKGRKAIEERKQAGQLSPDENQKG